MTVFEHKTEDCKGIPVGRNGSIVCDLCGAAKDELSEKVEEARRLLRDSAAKYGGETDATKAIHKLADAILLLGGRAVLKEAASSSFSLHDRVKWKNKFGRVVFDDFRRKAVKFDDGKVVVGDEEWWSHVRGATQKENRK